MNPLIAQDLKLVESLLASKQSAWTELCRAYMPLLQSCIRRVLVRRPQGAKTDDCEEVFANFCVQLLSNDMRKLRAFDPARGVRLSTWLGMLATNCAFDFMRSSRRQPAPNHDESILDSIQSLAPNQEDITSVREELSSIREWYGTLSARDQEFFYLYFDAGLEAQEISDRMGLNAATVYSKKHKILAKLDGFRREQSAA